MANNIKIINDYYDEGFKQAFRCYFLELGINLKENTTVFDEITKSAEDEGMRTLVLEEDGVITGFIMFQAEEFSSKSRFFMFPAMFIRELFIKKEYRNSGLGRLLIFQVIEIAKKEAIHKVILTTDSALEFYQKLGFVVDVRIIAKNKDMVLVKDI